MKGFTATNTITLKDGSTSTPFIRLVDFDYKSSLNRVDCVIEVCESLTTFNNYESAVLEHEDKKSSIANVITNAKAHAASKRPNMNANKKAKHKAQAKKYRNDYISLRDSEPTPVPEVFTRQYPSFKGIVTKPDEDGVYALIKAGYSGVEDVT